MNVVIHGKDGVQPVVNTWTAGTIRNAGRQTLCVRSAEDSSLMAVCSLSSNTGTLEREGASAGHLLQPPTSGR